VLAVIDAGGDHATAAAACFEMLLLGFVGPFGNSYYGQRVVQ